MSEALARVRNDSILARPAKPPGAGRGVVRRLAKGACALPVRFYIGAAFSALLAGIGVNALLLQRERHPAPLFASSRPRAAPVSQRSPAPADAGPVFLPTSGASAPPRPATADNAPAIRSTDQIGEFLRGGAAPGADVSRTVAAAQAALARLGYPVKADGVEGAATEQALHEFQRAHGLPLTTEITAHLIKQLTTAARAAGR